MSARKSIRVALLVCWFLPIFAVILAIPQLVQLFDTVGSAEALPKESSSPLNVADFIEIAMTVIGIISWVGIWRFKPWARSLFFFSAAYSIIMMVIQELIPTANPFRSTIFHGIPSEDQISGGIQFCFYAGFMVGIGQGALIGFLLSPIWKEALAEVPVPTKKGWGNFARVTACYVLGFAIVMFFIDLALKPLRDKGEQKYAQERLEAKKIVDDLFVSAPGELGVTKDYSEIEKSEMLPALQRMIHDTCSSDPVNRCLMTHVKEVESYCKDLQEFCAKEITTDTANIFLRNWNINKALFQKYGGRVFAEWWGPCSFDATVNYLKMKNPSVSETSLEHAQLDHCPMINDKILSGEQAAKIFETAPSRWDAQHQITEQSK